MSSLSTTLPKWALALTLAAQAGAASAQAGYYDERAWTSGGETAHRVLEPHASPSTRYTASSTGDGGGTAEQVSFASDPAPYVFARAEAWNGGFLVPGSGFQASLSYGFSVSGPANGLVPLRFRGQYAISNDLFLTQTGVSFAIIVFSGDFSRADQIGMEASCSGGYDGASCYATRDGSPTVNGSIQVTQRLLGVEPVLWGVAVDGGFEGVLMAPTDAAGLAQGIVGLEVHGGASGSRSNGAHGVSWAFIDPELTIDPDYLAQFPAARLMLTPGVGNQLAALPVPEPATLLLMLGGLAGLVVRTTWRRPA